jgi:hypothetical protein
MQQHIAQAHHTEKNYVFLQDPVFQELKLADAEGHREVVRGNDLSASPSTFL